jgi:hypothetical protein
MLIRCRQLSFGSESQFRCRTQNSAVNVNSLQPIQFRQRITISLMNTQVETQFRQRITNLLQNTSFGSECQFATDDTVSAANHNFAAEHMIRQLILIRCRRHSFSSESQFRCRQLIFGNESQFRCWTSNSAATVNSLQSTQFRQWMLIHCSRHNFGSEC